MMKPFTSFAIILLLALIGCQQEEPKHQAKPAAAPSNGTYENHEPVATDNQPVDVQVTRPTRQDLIYTITL
ncbi:MAG: hypothetical protein HY038_11580, partial [Nitrospirae bacterium]|nr:hypothetical protein [Nitrospirota bacterium]